MFDVHDGCDNDDDDNDADDEILAHLEAPLVQLASIFLASKTLIQGRTKPPSHSPKSDRQPALHYRCLHHSRFQGPSIAWVQGARVYFAICGGD